jgi:hypothetical protein
MKLYYKIKISALFEEEMERKYPDGLEIPKKQRVKEQGEFVQALYDRESSEIKDIVSTERSRLYDEAVKQWEEEHSSSHAPEAVQRHVTLVFIKWIKAKLL